MSEEIKVGSTVLIESRYRKDIAKVSAETKLYWIVDGTKFRKKNLYSTSDKGWTSTSIRPISEEEENKIRFAQKAKRCRILIEENAKNISDNLAVQIWEVIKQQKQETDGKI